MKGKLILMIVAAAMFIVPVGALASSAGATGEPGQHVTICHATDSDTNPYVRISPDVEGVLNGHAGHTGPVWDPTLKAQHIKWGDIIPPFDYGYGQHFPGLNWDAAGQAIYNNGCVPVTPPPPEQCLTPEGCGSTPPPPVQVCPPGTQLSPPDTSGIPTCGTATSVVQPTASPPAPVSTPAAPAATAIKAAPHTTG